MKVVNVHERTLPAPAGRMAVLIDGLASTEDRLWPRDRWPAMKLDRPLGVGAVGGHGPIRYTVEGYEPGQRVRFRFDAPEGFAGGHRFELEAIGGDRSRLRHVIEMQVGGRAALAWALAIRPLHDALMEDAMDRAEIHAGGRCRDPGHRG